MLLEPHDLKLFFKLQWALLFFVNQRLKVVPDPIASPTAFAGMPPKVVIAVRDALNANLDLIESFVSENPARLTDDELAIVRSWQHRVQGKFYIFRKLAKYTVFLSTSEPPVAFGVPGPFPTVRGSGRPASAVHGGRGSVALQGQDHL